MLDQPYVDKLCKEYLLQADDKKLEYQSNLQHQIPKIIMHASEVNTYNNSFLKEQQSEKKFISPKKSKFRSFSAY